MAIRMMAGAISTAAATAVVLDQESDARDGPAPTPDVGYRPLRAGAARERSGGVTRSARPWPSHVLRAAAPDSDSVTADTELPCRR